MKGCSIALFALGAIAACGTPTKPLPPAPPPPAPAAPFDLVAVTREVDLLFGTSGSVPAPGPDPATTLRALVRDRLQQEDFYDQLAPRLFTFLVNMRGFSYQVAPFTLTRGEHKGRPFYYLDDPCEADELETVRPWWDPSTPIRVCTKDVQPKLVKDPNSGAYCEASENPAPERSCGCGAHLINCAKDPEQAQALQQAARDEIVQTLRWTVQQHRPLGELLGGSETARSGLGNFFYQRSEYFRTGVLGPVDVSAPAARSPRPEGFTGGILTSPYVLYYDSARRPIMAALWHDLLCVPFTSTHVTAEDILQVGLNFRKSSRPVLAEKEGCRTCHVRLEYGMRALEQFPDGRAGQRFDPTRPADLTTRFYVRDEHDLRGEGAASPAWFGQMFRAQPEFATCMADKTIGYVYAGYSVNEHDRAALVAGFRKGEDLATLIEEAVIARFLGAK